MSELKPCPFCGTSVVGIEYDGLYRWVECGNMDCNAAGKVFAFLTDVGNADHIVANNWNTRPIEDGLRAELARLTAELAELNDKAVFIQFENEDELPADISNDVYSTMFNCSHVDGVRLFPYIEENGQKYFLVMIDDFVGDSDHEHDDRIL